MNKTFLSNKLILLKNKFLVLKKPKLLLAIFFLIIIISIVVQPTKYIQIAYQGILVWATQILPALFPFMIFTKLLTSTGYVESASKIFSPITKKLYNTPGISSYVFLMSILSGYPLGAKITSDLYSNKLLTRSQASRIVSFTSNSGPMFIIGTVGVGMLVSPISGYIILLSHILGSLINGLLYRKYNPKEIKVNNYKNETVKDDVLTQTMFNGINSCLLIGGYITIFFIITESLYSLGIFSSIENLLNCFGVEKSITKGLMFGFFEITKGCLLISSSLASLQIKTALCSLLISFGGLAISFQAFAFLNSFKISKKYYFLQKTTHATISFIIALILSYLLI